MSLGINLLMYLTEITSSSLGKNFLSKINEIHHKHKKDYPSGTALMLGKGIAVGKNKNFYKIYIDYPRDILVNKIRNRAQDMINKGAILEAKRFLNMKVSKRRTATKAIGLIEIQDFIDKKIKINEVIERISIKTRQYAKRQATWGRGNMMDWNKIRYNRLNNFLKNI